MVTTRQQRGHLRMLAVVFGVIGCASAAAAPVGNKSSHRGSPTWVDSVLASLTLRDKVAQLVWPQVYGDYAAENTATWARINELIGVEHVGGFILSVGSPYETAVRLNTMQARSTVPLLIAADYETGAGFRTRGGYFLPNAINLGGATTFAPQMALGATRDSALAYEQGRVTAREARALGVQFVFAPVMDVNNNPSNPVIGPRSFGEDPELVGRMGAALIRGLQEHGVIATAKHFPGHGDTETNSHLEITRVNASRARLDTLELVPFRRAISAGVGAIMTFHGVVPALDTTPIPVTLSPRVMTDLLRRELRFDGLLLTDALDMTGVLAQVHPTASAQVQASAYGTGTVVTSGVGEVATLAVLAGDDVLLMPSDVPGAIDAVVAAVRAGRISESRIDASARRILQLKHDVGLSRARLVNLDSVGAIVGDSAHVQLAQQIAQRSITLAKDSLRLVPLRRSPAPRVLSITIANRPDLAAGTIFNSEIARGTASLRTEYVDPLNPDLSLDRLVSLADSSDVTIVSSYLAQGSTVVSTAAPANILALFQRLALNGRPLVVVSFGNPYLLREIPEVPTYMLAWGPFAVSQRAAARAVLGDEEITGRMPISIPPSVTFGAGEHRAAVSRVPTPK
jgi:beta-N-acetylhexosaminidase